MKKYTDGSSNRYGREWKWWIIFNDHSCKLCWAQNIALSLGKLTGKSMVDKGYYNSLYQVWLKHINEYHPELVELETRA